jgi:predicted RNA binding protein with dsRBD fold (UPF0201 family)
MIPQIDCKIEAVCQINPSEDPEKIKQVFANILEEYDLKMDRFSAKAISKHLESLTKIRESIHNHQSKKVYRRFLNDNMDGNTTWFYLNKQAAFVSSIALCEHDDESPLGPIKITLSSADIERVIEWMTS